MGRVSDRPTQHSVGYSEGPRGIPKPGARRRTSRTPARGTPGGGIGRGAGGTRGGDGREAGNPTRAKKRSEIGTNQRTLAKTVKKTTGIE